MGLILWLIAVALVFAGVLAVVRRDLVFGVLLIVLGLLVGPGGVSLLA